MKILFLFLTVLVFNACSFTDYRIAPDDQFNYANQPLTVRIDCTQGRGLFNSGKVYINALISSRGEAIALGSENFFIREIDTKKEFSPISWGHHLADNEHELPGFANTDYLYDVTKTPSEKFELKNKNALAATLEFNSLKNKDFFFVIKSKDKTIYSAKCDWPYSESK